MTTELCAYNFGNDIDGTYKAIDTDHWSNGTYFILKDNDYWMISSSDYRQWSNTTMPGHTSNFLKARKAYVKGSWADGHYDGVDGNPSGDVSIGIC